MATAIQTPQPNSASSLAVISSVQPAPDLPTLEIARLNQLIDQMKSLSTNVANPEAVTINGFDSLMGLTRGDNYLLDAEDGEIGAEG